MKGTLGMAQSIAEAKISEWSAQLRGWAYDPAWVIPPSPPDGLGFRAVDCPLVWSLDGQWQMFYTGFDGQGYRTARAESADLVNWTYRGEVMGFGAPGSFDHGGVTFGGLLFEDWGLRSPRKLARYEGRFWALYGCYPRQGGYELRPGAQGAAWSLDGIAWHRASREQPILSIDGAAAWEADCIYQPWLVQHDGQFWNFYNAARGSIEQMGLATSTDLRTWHRYSGNPILRNGPNGSYDEAFCADGKVFWDNDHWVMIYFGVGRGGAHIMVAYSLDMVHWVKDPTPLYLAGGHPGGLDARYAHKVSLVHQADSDTFHMFYCAVDADGNRGIARLTSRELGPQR